MITTIPVLSNQNPTISIIRPAEEKKPRPDYIIKEGENLSGIAEKERTTVQRLWAKNPDLTNPDLISVNYQLKVPTPDENLPDRPYPQQNASEPIKNSSGVINGGGYDAGFCTAYAWSRRQDLPSNLGDGTTWGVRAAAQGFPVDGTPQAGDIGVTKAYNHVVYIEHVNDDGTVFLSEMNYAGWNVVSTRTAPITEFVYIHKK